MTKEKNEVAVVDEKALALAAELGFDYKDNFTDGATPRLPQIKIKHQAQSFELNEGEKVDTIEGVIIHYSRANAWWKNADDGGSPQCASSDGNKPNQGDDMQSDSCRTCPLNKWGSAVSKDGEKGKGKACKNTYRLHLMMPDAVFPYRLTVPPTSMTSFDTFMTELTNQQKPYKITVVKFSLQQKKEGSREWSEMQFKAIGMLDTREKMMKVKEVSEKFSESFHEEIEGEELQTSSEPPINESAAKVFEEDAKKESVKPDSEAANLGFE